MTVLAARVYVRVAANKEEKKMASPASIAGHPIHPMLIPFPIALWVVGVIAVTIYGWLGGELVFKHGVVVNPQHDTPPEEAAKARVS